MSILECEHESREFPITTETGRGFVWGLVIGDWAFDLRDFVNPDNEGRSHGYVATHLPSGLMIPYGWWRLRIAVQAIDAFMDQVWTIDGQSEPQKASEESRWLIRETCDFLWGDDVE